MDLNEEIVQRFAFRRREFSHVLQRLGEFDVRRFPIEDSGQRPDGFFHEVGEKRPCEVRRIKRETLAVELTRRRRERPHSGRRREIQRRFRFDVTLALVRVEHHDPVGAPRIKVRMRIGDIRSAL